MLRFRFECLFFVIITLSSGCGESGGSVEKTDTETDANSSTG